MTIRPTIKNGRSGFTLDAGVLDGRRRQFWFRTKREAEKRRGEIECDRKAVGAAWTEIPARERAEVVRVLAEMRAAGVTLAGVWQAYQSGAGGKAIVSMPIGEAIAELLAAKRNAGRRENYLTNLQTHLDDFAKGREHAAIASVSLREVEAYVGAGKSPGSRVTRANRLSTLLSFAVRRGWLAENPCRKLERPREDWKQPVIFTVEQCRALLDAARKLDAAFLPHLALCLFAGVRPGEARRLSWKDVDLKAGLLTIKAAASKVRQRRIVELPEAAVAWLRLGGELPAVNARERRAAVAAVAKLVPWPRDGLRHTAASYWHARHGEVVAARNLGHSEVILHRHYRALVTPDDAKEFFALLPVKAAGPA